MAYVRTFVLEWHVWQPIGWVDGCVNERIRQQVERVFFDILRHLWQGQRLTPALPALIWPLFTLAPVKNITDENSRSSHIFCYGDLAWNMGALEWENRTQPESSWNAGQIDAAAQKPNPAAKVSVVGVVSQSDIWEYWRKERLSSRKVSLSNPISFF